MKIRPFLVEQWIDKYEAAAKWNIAETCVNPMSLDEFIELTGENKDELIKRIFSTRMTYGPIQGGDEFRQGVANLFKTVKPEEVLETQGAIGANYLLQHALVDDGDEVVSVMPTYQQLYSIPESIGAKVHLIPLNPANNYLPDLDLLRKSVNQRTKVINLNNPNNPSGSVMDEATLREIVSIAKSVGAYVICDEVYRGLVHDGSYQPSIVDLYEKGISVGSMSKVFSMSGLRTGWIVFHDPMVNTLCHRHRDYSVITCGVVHDILAGVVLKHANEVIERNRAIVNNNCKILEDWVAAHSDNLTMFKPTAGTTAMVYFKDLPVDGWEFCQTLIDDYQTLLTPGECFETPNSVRVGYACSEEELIGGLAQVDKYIKTLKK